MIARQHTPSQNSWFRNWYHSSTSYCKTCVFHPSPVGTASEPTETAQAAQTARAAQATFDVSSPAFLESLSKKPRDATENLFLCQVRRYTDESDENLVDLLNKTVFRAWDKACLKEIWRMDPGWTIQYTGEKQK